MFLLLYSNSLLKIPTDWTMTVTTVNYIKFTLLYTKKVIKSLRRIFCALNMNWNMTFKDKEISPLFRGTSSTLSKFPATSSHHRAATPQKDSDTSKSNYPDAGNSISHRETTRPRPTSYCSISFRAHSRTCVRTPGRTGTDAVNTAARRLWRPSLSGQHKYVGTRPCGGCRANAKHVGSD